MPEASVLREQTIKERFIQEPSINKQLIQEQTIQEQIIQEQMIQEQMIQEQIIQEQMIQEQAIIKKVIKEPVAQTSVDQRKFSSLLGISQKAGCVVTGEDAILRAIRSGKAKLVIIAEDASSNTIKMYTDKSTYYHIPCHIMMTRERLSQAIGKLNRPALCIVDNGLAAALLKLIV